MDIMFTDQDGKQKPFYLASYGIGVTRVMGVIVEKFSDDHGLVWPENIAPFKVYLARLGESEGVVKAADELYHQLQDTNIEVLYDDREVRPGEKFADAELMGIPYRIVISEKTIAEGKVELKARTKPETTLIETQEVLNTLAD
jgi:prolyl-tRNA synthetase